MISLTNLNAMRSAAAMAESNADIKTSMERLSTGSRINSASDDAAGLAISVRMDTQILGLAKAIANGSDAIGLLSTADGALGEVSSLLQRMRELSLQSATGSATTADRTYLNDEYQRLKNEIDRIGSQTQWNGMNIFDGVSFPGTTQFQVGANANQTIGVEITELSTRSLAETSTVQLGSDIDGEAAGDSSGLSVSISGDGTTVVIGARDNDDGGAGLGHARIFRYDSGTSSWQQLGSDIDGSLSFYKAGWSVSTSDDGETVAIGAPYSSGQTGYTRIYQYQSATDSWAQVGTDIAGPRSNADFGMSVSLSSDGDSVVVGAPRAGVGSTHGHAYVYKYDDSVADWTQVGGSIGNPPGPNASTAFGSAVSISNDGSVMASAGTSSTEVYAYDSGSGSWVQRGLDVESGANAVALSGDGSIVAVGIPTGNGDNSGLVRIYKYDSSSSSWSQLGEDIHGESSDDQSGYSVALSDDGLVVSIGANGNDGGGSGAGHARAYQYDEASARWIQLGNDIDGEAAGDASGTAISISSDGSVIAVGANGNNGNGIGSGQVRVYKLSNLSLSSVTSQVNAETALGLVDQAHASLSTMRATYGAVINQITHAIDNLSNTLVNTASSESRIADTDYAKESSNLASAQIRNQGAKAMLAQANTDQELTLQLIEDWL